MSRYAQLEQDNSDRFDALSSKLSAFRRITSDINDQAEEENSVLSSLTDGLGNLTNGVKSTSTKLARVMNQNSSLIRLVLIILLGFVIFWTLLKLW